MNNYYYCCYCGIYGAYYALPDGAGCGTCLERYKKGLDPEMRREIIAAIKAESATDAAFERLSWAK